MKLLVGVIEARNIPAVDPNGFSDPYVKLSLGKQKFKSKVVKKCLNPSWCEEFAFKVKYLKEELIISVLNKGNYFNDDFVGQIKFPVSQVFDANEKSLGTAWYTLQPKHKKGKYKDCGQILLTISFSQGNILADFQSVGDHGSLSKKLSDVVTESPSLSSNGPLRSSSPLRSEEAASSKKEKPHAQTFADRIARIFNKNGDAVSTTNAKASDVTVPPETASTAASENAQEEQSTSGNFQELLKSIVASEQPSEVPNLPGIVVDQLYAVASHELNLFLFSPDSTFFKSLVDLQGSTELRVGPWKLENGGESLKRVVNYIKAASRFVQDTEEQTYLKADGKSFSVLATVSTPDAPYGSMFRTEVLYSITPGPEMPSGEQSSRLVVSWRMNFLQSTMMEDMIEYDARQGIKESFDQYANLLSQNVKPFDAKDIGSEKEQILASIEMEHQSDRKQAFQYFANFTVISTFFIGLYVLVHVLLAMLRTIQGLVGLDLPDSIGEIIVCGLLVLQGERVLELISRFMRAHEAWEQKGSDHGIKAQGDGWVLTVALIEGNLEGVDPSGFSDKYVVFTCNGKTRTSSIKYQESNPKWNEIFEFDAMVDPPSVMDVEVFDFDASFSEVTSLGHAEINFVKTNKSDLSDVWVPLQGNLAPEPWSKLHLRVFLNNTKGINIVKDYLSKMEKEVGKKIKLRSPQTNSAFQKLFGLPQEEFLINDFICRLQYTRRNQGHLFLSTRIIGFHSDLYKNKFFLLWEDIEDIQVESPPLASKGSPDIIMTLELGRGSQAGHDAIQDEKGRVKLHFHFFVSFNVAHRTIMALWKARTLSPDPKVQIDEAEAEAKSLQMAEEDSIGIISKLQMMILKALPSIGREWIIRHVGRI